MSNNQGKGGGGAAQQRLSMCPVGVRYDLMSLFHSLEGIRFKYTAPG